MIKSNQAAYTNLSCFERRNMTVLECDLVGSTALANKLDPEQLKDLLLIYQNLVRQCIDESGGYISQYAGDAVWAYFGIQDSEENDVYRAICAALKIINKIESLRPGDQRLRVRIGVANGLCVVGELYDETGGMDKQLEKRVTAFGNPPNLAARLQAMAEPGTIAVSDITHSLASTRFEFEDLKWHQFKGFPKPMKVWKVIAEYDKNMRNHANPANCQQSELCHPI